MKKSFQTRQSQEANIELSFAFIVALLTIFGLSVIVSNLKSGVEREHAIKNCIRVQLQVPAVCRSYYKDHRL